MPAIHPELAKVFAEHAAPTHASKRSVHDQLAPVLKTASDAQRQVAEYRSQLTQAMVAEHDHELDSKMEHMFQTLGAAEREAAAFAQSGRLLAQAFTQLDRYMAEWRADVARWQALPDSAPAASGS